MVFRNAILPAAAAYGSAMFVLLLAPAARACSCSFRSLCDNIDFADVVLRGNVSRRTEVEDQFEDVTYSIRIISLFKTEAGEDYPEDIEITTAANSAACGVYLEVGEEYLLDLSRYEGDLRSVGLCGATQTWATLDEEKIDTLADIEAACSPAAEDPCGGACDEFQECLFYTGDVAEDQYYCSAVCDPSPCDEGEECSLTVPGCSAGSICGNGYSCSPAAADDDKLSAVEEEDPCEGRCSEHYECLFYTGDVAADQYYCSAVCDPSPCEEGEECSLTVPGCSAGSICGNGYVCSSSQEEKEATVEEEEDPCEGRCPEFYECLFYSGDIADDQYYCSAVCDPSPCEAGEACSLTAVGCSAGSICGNGYVCSPGDEEEKDVIVEDCTACGEFEDCLVWSSGSAEEFYCADICDPSPCTSDETCSLQEPDDCDTAAGPCPPVATCSSAVVAAEGEETEADGEAQEDTSSALRLAVGSLTTAAVLMATLLLEL